MLWKGIKSIISINSGNNGTILYVKDKYGSKLSDPFKIVTEFNKYFTNVANSIKKQIPRIPKSPLDYLSNPNLQSFFTSPSTPDEVSMLIDKVWICHHKISIPVRLKLYNCYVKPVLLYNSGTWGLTKGDLDCLDSFHRQQLRQVLNVIYPNIIKNKDLYERTNEQPLSLTILKNRWKLFGHTLRLNSETPARKSMLCYFTDSLVDKE